jgi:hypothetical protein
MAANLVHNAIVHNLPEQGTVWVKTSVHLERAVLTVENTGEQLTSRSVSTLAEPFQRGSERIRTDHAGAGLGLAIVKSITRAHDGTLTLTPRRAGGLRVAVQLPAAPEGRRAPSVRSGGERAAKGDQAGARDTIGDADGAVAHRAACGRGAGGEQAHPAQAADADASHQDHGCVAGSGAGRGGEDRRPRGYGGRIGGGGGHGRGERAPR